MEKLKRLYQKRFGIYGKLLLSFLIILGIPIIISTFFYTYTVKLMQRQSDRMGQNILEMVKQDIDAQLENARNFESQWFLNTTVQELAGIEGPLSKDHSQALFQLYTELIRRGSTEPMLKKAFIYFSGPDKIVSTDGNMDFDMYYNLYLNKEAASQKQIRTLLQDHHQYDILMLPGSDNKQYPTMLLSIKDSSGRFDTATIAYLFDPDQLQSAFFLLKAVKVIWS